MPSSATMPHHKPYPPTKAGLGGQPTPGLDVPISAIFLVLFIIGAATHMTIFQKNKARGQKFIMSGMTFGFCMSRITANVMRIVWAYRHKNVSVAIAAQIFVAAGVVLLFVINLIFTQRVIRATHPTMGWTKTFSWAFKIYYATIVITIIALITSVIQSFYTLDQVILLRDRDIMRFGSTYFAVSAFLPLPLLALNFLIPRRSSVEKFGEGRFRTKVAIIVIAAVILTLGAAFRAGVAYMPRPISNPAWYHSKACFYLFDFTVDISVVFLFAVIRVDRRFIVPNGSSAPGHYSQRQLVVLSEDEVFEDDKSENRIMSNLDVEAQRSANPTSTRA